MDLVTRYSNPQITLNADFFNAAGRQALARSVRLRAKGKTQKADELLARSKKLRAKYDARGGSRGAVTVKAATKLAAFPIRNGLLLGLKINLFNLSAIMYPAVTMSLQQALLKGFSKEQYQKSKKLYEKTRTIFLKLQGQESSLINQIKIGGQKKATRYADSYSNATGFFAATGVEEAAVGTALPILIDLAISAGQKPDVSKQDAEDEQAEAILNSSLSDEEKDIILDSQAEINKEILGEMPTWGKVLIGFGIALGVAAVIYAGYIVFKNEK